MNQEYLCLGYIKYCSTSSIGLSGMRAIDFWVNTTLEGYIIEFAAQNHQYFSRAEEDFKKGARRIMLREIPLWIKVFLMEEGILTMSPTEMVV
jgi:hypothetical protein